MNAWHMLGLAPNSDLQAIKQAYAVKIKQFRPDTDPEQFQRIHQAYKELTTRLRRQAKTATADTESTATRHTTVSDEPLSWSANDRSTLADLSDANEPTPDEQQLQTKPPQRQPFAEAEALAPQQPADAEQQRAEAELWSLQLLDESERRRTPAERWAQQMREEAQRLRVEAEQRAQQELADSERRQLASEQARQQYKQERQQLRQQRWQERQTLFNQAMAELLQQVDENLKDLNKLKSLESWLFLTQSTWMLESEFNKQLSAAVLQRLVAYHKNPLTSFATSRKGRGRHREQPVPTRVLKLLDQLFNWRGQQESLLRGPDQSILAEMFERLDLDAEASAVDALRGKAKVVLNEQTPAPQQRPFDWGSLIPWLTLMVIIGHAFKYLQGS